MSTRHVIPRPGFCGSPDPIGATLLDRGVNFSLFSRTAAEVSLLLFERADDATPARILTLDPVNNRTYHYWHVFVPGVRPGQLYGYRVQGPDDPSQGLRFDDSKVLLDPYGRGVVIPPQYTRQAAARRGADNAGVAMKSVVVDSAAYDWEGDLPLRRPSARTIIYEMHVRGFTRHPNSGVAEELRGTYAGLVEKQGECVRSRYPKRTCARYCWSHAARSRLFLIPTPADFSFLSIPRAKRRMRLKLASA